MDRCGTWTTPIQLAISRHGWHNHMFCFVKNNVVVSFIFIALLLVISLKPFGRCLFVLASNEITSFVEDFCEASQLLTVQVTSEDISLFQVRHQIGDSNNLRVKAVYIIPQTLFLPAPCLMDIVSPVVLSLLLLLTKWVMNIAESCRKS